MSIFVHESSIVESDCIGEGTKIWHFCHIMKGAKIGKNCVLGQNVFVADDAVIGDNVRIQNNVSVYKGVILKNNVFVGPSCVFTNVRNPRAELNQKNNYDRTAVCEGATIGANATIVCGNTLGSYAFIGAGAVVTKFVSDFSLVAGNPAERVGWVGKAGQKLLLVDAGAKVSVYQCPATGHYYLEEQGRLEPCL